MYPAKKKEVKTVPGYKEDLDETKQLTANLPKTFVACFRHEMYLKTKILPT